MSRPCFRQRKPAWRALCAGVAAALLSLCSTMPPARATIQEDSCIYPDVEYPMPCDEDGD